MQRLPFRLQLPDESIDIALACADRAQEDHFGLPLLAHRGDRDRLFVDIQPDEKCASVCQG